jgi:hypothetical protein
MSYFRTDHHLDVSGRLRRVRTFTVAESEAAARAQSKPEAIAAVSGCADRVIYAFGSTVPVPGVTRPKSAQVVK